MERYFCEKGDIKKVAIIGAGESGLVSIKSCLEERLEPVCFERESQIGGLWTRKPDKNTKTPITYESLVFNTSKEMSCFSDFPHAKTTPIYMRRHHIVNYLHEYADNFDLRKYIRLNSEVLKVEPVVTADGTQEKWRVRWQSTNDSTNGNANGSANGNTNGSTHGCNDVQEEVFDAVMVCNGLNNEARIPEYPGQEDVKGSISHSCSFQTGADFKDKTVLVIGGSHSGGDVSCECSRNAKQVYLSMTDGTWILPRCIAGGQPLDAFGNKQFMSYIPLFIKRLFFLKMLAQEYNIDKLGIRPLKRDVFGATQLVSDDLVSRILCGSVQPKPGIDHFTERGVVFVDGSELSGIDAIIFATGFLYRFPFLEESLVSEDPAKNHLYLHIFPTHLLRPTLTCIGMVGAMGSSIPIFESQSRLAVQVFTGNIKLPCKEKMNVDIEKERQYYFKLYGRYTVIINIPKYQSLLGSIGNFGPSIKECLLSGDFYMAYHLFFQPFYPYVMRLRGCHAWSRARECVLQANVNQYSAIEDVTKL